MQKKSEIDANLLESGVPNDYSIVVEQTISVIGNISFDPKEKLNLVKRGCCKGHFDQYDILESSDEFGARKKPA